MIEDLREMIDRMFAYGNKDSVKIYYDKDIIAELTRIIHKRETLITSCGSEIYNSDFRGLVTEGVIVANEGSTVYCYEIKR